MAFLHDSAKAGWQAIAETSTTLNHPLGTRVRAIDSTYGEGEFIYLQGIGSTVVGSMVKWDGAYLTALVTNTAVQARPVAIAMSANVASQYGWYQIAGVAVIKKTAVAVSPEVALYISATAGRVKVLASAGLQIVGCRSGNTASVTSTTSTVIAVINYPHLQSQIT